MTIRDRRELQSRLTALLHRLLKIRVQPGQLTRSWVDTILEQQREIGTLIQGIPSLGRQADSIAAEAYPHAVRAARRDTGVATPALRHRRFRRSRRGRLPRRWRSNRRNRHRGASGIRD